MSNSTSAAPKTPPTTPPTIAPVDVPSSSSEFALSASELFVEVAEFVEADEDNEDESVLGEDEMSLRPG